jgi:hypothetical protein
MINKFNKLWPLIIFLVTGLNAVPAQDIHNILLTEVASASFFSKAPLENIEAENTGVRAALNIDSGEIMFLVNISGFEFEKSLMQKHFNEQYMESNKFPESRFEGYIMDWTGKPVRKTNVNIRGRLTIHGVTREITEKATLEPEGDKIRGTSIFLVRLEDYKIKIPKMVIKNIAEVVEVKIIAVFEPQ